VLNLTSHKIYGYFSLPNMHHTQKQLLDIWGYMRKHSFADHETVSMPSMTAFGSCGRPVYVV